MCSWDILKFTFIPYRCFSLLQFYICGHKHACRGKATPLFGWRCMTVKAFIHFSHLPLLISFPPLKIPNIHMTKVLLHQLKEKKKPLVLVKSCPAGCFCTNKNLTLLVWQASHSHLLGPSPERNIQEPIRSGAGRTWGTLPTWTNEGSSKENPTFYGHLQHSCTCT